MVDRLIGPHVRLFVIKLESASEQKIPQCVLQMMPLDAIFAKQTHLIENYTFSKCLDTAMKS